MADMLIYWGPHWMETATVEQLSETHLGKRYREKVESRLRPGDLCVVGRDGQYVHARLKKMRCIQVPDFPMKKAAELTSALERPRTPAERAGDAEEEERVIESENQSRLKKQKPLMASEEVQAFRNSIRDDQNRRTVLVGQKSHYIDLTLLDEGIQKKLKAREPVTMSWAEIESLIFIKGV